MPLYEFSCPTCGPFEAFRSVEKAGARTPCPECGTRAARVFTTPGIARVSAVVRDAHERNEKSRHEPDVAHRPSHAGHDHGPGTHHGSSGRPWQIGH